MSDITIRVNKGHMDKRQFIFELLKIMVPGLTGSEQTLLTEILCTDPYKLDYDCRRKLLQSDLYKDDANAERLISVTINKLCARRYTNEFLVTKVKQGVYTISKSLAKHIETISKRPVTKIEFTLTYDPHTI